MRKIRKLCVFFICSSILFFTSCVDYVQTLTVDGDSYNSYYKIAIPRVFFESGEMTAEEFFLQLENFGSILPENSELNMIDNGEDIGLEFYVSVDVNTEDELEQEYLPYARQDGSEAFLPFLIGNFAEIFNEILYAEGDEEMQALVFTYMSGSKCRLLLSKTAIPNLDLTGAYFSGENGEIWNLACYDYGESYCIEMPLSTLVLGNGYGLDLSNIVIY